MRSLLASTRVCRRLRAIAISCPSLWTVIPAHLSGAAALAERAAPLPLQVYLIITQSGEFGAVSRLPVFQEPYRSRVQELHLIQQSPCRNHTQLQEVLSSVAPKLSYLTISPLGHEDVSPALPFPIPKNVVYCTFFPQCDSVPLRAMALSLEFGIFPRPYGNRFPSLAHLRISGSTTIDALSFLQILADTPMLETLYIADKAINVLGGMDGLRDSMPIVHLSRLRALVADNPDLGGISAVLDRLEFPPHVDIQLHGIDVNNPSEIDMLVLPVIGELTTLEIAEGFPDFHIRARGTHGGFWVHVRIVWASVSHCVSITDAFFAKLAPLLATVHTLRLGARLFMPTTETSLLELVIPHATAHMPNLSTLLLACNNDVPSHLAPAVQVALLPYIPSDPVVPCPSLEQLVIQSHFPIPDYTPLVEALEERARLGHPIRELCISNTDGRDREGTIARVRSSGMADHVETMDLRDKMVWDLKGDLYWRVDSPAYWALYPDEKDMDRLWRLPLVGW